MTATRHPGRRCSMCGEPIDQHTLRDLAPHQRVLIISSARTRQDAAVRLRTAMRVCPVEAVETLAGQTRRWAAKCLVRNGLRRARAAA